MSGNVTRRDALRKIAVGGAAVVTSPLWVETLTSAAEQHAAHYQPARGAAAAAWKPKVLSASQNELVVVISEIIIPQTETAGAKAAKVNEFVDSVLAEAPAPEREKFVQGLAWIDARSQSLHGVPFLKATAEQQTNLLKPLSLAVAAEADRPGAEFFAAIKNLTITGYYTSEIASREELDDPGTLFFAEFKGCTHPQHGAK
jgi:Gluconate 2-dehydrogenase subunit 3